MIEKKMMDKLTERRDSRGLEDSKYSFIAAGSLLFLPAVIARIKIITTMVLAFTFVFLVVRVSLFIARYIYKLITTEKK